MWRGDEGVWGSAVTSQAIARDDVEYLSKRNKMFRKFVVRMAVDRARKLDFAWLRLNCQSTLLIFVWGNLHLK